MTRGLGALATLALVVASCASFSDATRKDIEGRMASIQGGLDGCYQAALTRNRALAGGMELAFVAESKTGQFKDVRIPKNDLPDPELVTCVTSQVGALKLAKPTSTNLSIAFPLRFVPQD